MNSNCFDHCNIGFIALQTPPSNGEFTQIIDNFSFTIHNPSHSFFNQIDNLWAVETMLTFAKYFVLKEWFEVVRRWGMEREQVS